MATLEKIRNRAGVLVAVVIGFALFAFILGDILGSGTSLFSNTQFEVAEIGGTSIPYQELQRKIDNLSEIYKMNTGEASLTTEVYESIYEQAWQQLVNEYVMQKEYDKLGILVGADELFDMVQGRNIHPIVRQIFTDPNTGMFNQEALLNFLRNMNQDPSGSSLAYWLFVESEIIGERKALKYNNLLEKGLYVTSLQAKNAFYETNKRIDFDFIVQRYTSIADTLVSISEKEIKDYYKKNKSDFQQEHSRDIEYVAFDIVPSDEDNRDAKLWIERMLAEFSSVQEVKQFTNLNSDIPYDNTNYSFGELSDEINNFMFNARVGDVYGPYLENGAYKIARLAEINFLPDSVRARHILIQPSETISQEQAKAKADSLLNLAKRGASFELLAIEHSTDNGSRFNGGDLGWFPEGMMVKPFNDACFAARKGDKFLVETQFGYHVIELMDRAADVKKVQVAVMAREVEPSTATYQRIFMQASSFAGANDTYEKFQNAVVKDGLSKRIANNLLPADNRIAGLESPREMIRWAFNTKEHSVSQVFEISNKFVVATVSKVREKGTKPLSDVREEIELTLKKDKKAEMIAAEMKNEISSGSSIDQIAMKRNLNIESALEISFTSFSIPNAGIEPKVIAYASSMEEGKISEPIAGENGVYLLRVTNIESPEQTDYAMEKIRLKNNFASRVGFEAYEALKKIAEIKDNRAKFF
jgi:peptidyl-prolyl cis-trans isomerase D